jgi:hypothetical protein
VRSDEEKGEGSGYGYYPFIRSNKKTANEREIIEKIFLNYQSRLVNFKRISDLDNFPVVAVVNYKKKELPDDRQLDKIFHLRGFQSLFERNVQ